MSGAWRSLPDGTASKDNDDYIEAWREFARPISEITGLRPFGYDPGVLFGSDEHLQSISLPTWFIKLVNDALEK